MWFVNTSRIRRWSHGRMVPLRLGITLNDCTLACRQAALSRHGVRMLFIAREATCQQTRSRTLA